MNVGEIPPLDLDSPIRRVAGHRSSNPLFRAVTVVPREPIGGDVNTLFSPMYRLPSYLLPGATFPNPYNSYRGRLFIRALQPPSAARVSEYALENPPER